MLALLYNKKEYLLIILIISPLINILYIYINAIFFKNKKIYKILCISIDFATINILTIILIFSFYKKFTIKFQYIYNLNIFWKYLNYNFYVGIDIIALMFLFLVVFIIPLCLLSLWESNIILIKEFITLILILELILFITFSSLDLLLFYIFFEGSLIPILFIVGIWGSRSSRIWGTFILIFYTSVGAFLQYLSIQKIYILCGSTDFITVISFQFSPEEEKFFWISFFFSFATKLPLFPFHTWLPETHVEAPTVGSVILASILLKLGVFGFLRYSLILFPYASIYFSPFVITLGIIGAISSALNAISQTDLKRVIAYSSISHINIVVLGLFSINLQGIEGAIFQSLSHGFTSAGLFFLVGCLYERTHTRQITDYSGICNIIPIISIFFFVLLLSNISFPGTFSFNGEFLILNGLLRKSFIFLIFANLNIILCAVYSLWIFNRVFFGNIKNLYIYDKIDITLREFFFLTPIIFFILFFGIFPNVILNQLHFNVIFLISCLNF